MQYGLARRQAVIQARVESVGRGRQGCLQVRGVARGVEVELERVKVAQPGQVNDRIRVEPASQGLAQHVNIGPGEGIAEPVRERQQPAAVVEEPEDVADLYRRDQRRVEGPPPTRIASCCALTNRFARTWRTIKSSRAVKRTL